MCVGARERVQMRKKNRNVGRKRGKHSTRATWVRWKKPAERRGERRTTALCHGINSEQSEGLNDDKVIATMAYIFRIISVMRRSHHTYTYTIHDYGRYEGERLSKSPSRRSFSFSKSRQKQQQQQWISLRHVINSPNKKIYQKLLSIWWQKSRHNNKWWE